jgi:hypothetical protein
MIIAKLASGVKLRYHGPMLKHNQNGAISGTGLSLIISIIFLLAAIGFGVWAFMGRQDYKNNVDQKIDVAVQKTIETEDAKQAKVFAEKEKNPLREYDGPDQFGSIQVLYPKTWSGYVVEAPDNKSATLVNGYFHPGEVPSVSDKNSSFSLRVQIVHDAYDTVAGKWEKRQEEVAKKGGTLDIDPYSLPLQADTVGIRVHGQLTEDKDGTVIVLPLRSDTLIISTDGSDYLKDFDTYILPNFNFVP